MPVINELSQIKIEIRKYLNSKGNLSGMNGTQKCSRVQLRLQQERFQDDKALHR